MYVPLTWLAEYVPLGIDPTDHDAVGALGAVLDGLGLVVEGIAYVGSGLDDVVLARVVEIAPIPGADRIRKVLVDRGDPTPTEVVCGAMNFAVGDVVPLAPSGAVLPGGFRIERRTMRGVTSDGMLCSGRELGLGDDHEGLLIIASPGPDGALPDGVVPGTRLVDHLDLAPDAVFDLAVEPNRPDALCITGVARDLAARLGLTFTPPTPEPKRTGPVASDLASVTTSVPWACDRILGRVLLGCAVVPSPPKIRRRLELAGVRPINAIVDASNYVMLELGQPTHPYDLDRLGGRGIGVRLARVGEELVTLDGTSRTLGVARTASGDLVELAELVVTDARDHVVGLAGVMGGSESQITPGTTDVLLEVAHFDPLIVGRAAARLGLRTEASQRFWRGTDPRGMDVVADRFCDLVVAAATAAGVPPPLVASGSLEDDRRAPADPPIALRTARVNALLGTSLDTPRIAALLRPLGFDVGGGAGDVLAVTPPGFRPDVTREVDCIEEVARHLGYDAIVGSPRRSPRPGALTDRQRRRRAVLRILGGLGVDEAWTSSLVDPAIEEAIGPDGVLLDVANPIAHPETALRTRLLPGLLDALRRNEAHRNGALRMFEIGRVFAASPDPEGRPFEREQLAVVLGWEADDAASALGVLRALLGGLRVAPEATRLEPLGEREDPAGAGCHPTRSAYLVRSDLDVEEAALGVVGEIDPALLIALGCAERRVGWLALDLDAFLALPEADVRARPVSTFPSSDLDLAFVLDDAVRAIGVEERLRAAAGDLLESVTLVDVYRGPSVPKGTRNLTYRLRLVALDRTLGGEEISAVRTTCIDAVCTELPARLRE